MKTKKFLCLFLAVIMTFFATSSNVVAFAVAPSYPEGVTETEANNALIGTENLLSYILKSYLKTDLKNVLEPMIYNDATVSELLVSVYAPMEETASDLKSIGIDVTINGVAKGLKNYPDVQNALINAGSFQNLDLTNVKWGVTDKISFAKAISAILSPFNNLLFMLLCSGKYSVANFTKIEGGNGYENAIVPMLKALGCEVKLSQEEFKNQAKEDKSTMIYNILMSALSIVDKLEKKPIDTLVTVLPSFAYFCESGQMDACFNNLLAPVKENAYIRLAILLKIIDLDSMKLDVEVMLNDALNGMTAESGLELPSIDFYALSQCGSSDGVTFTPNKPLAYTVIMSWLVDALKLNKNALPELLKGLNATDTKNDLLSPDILNKLLETDTKNVVKTIILLFNDSKLADAKSYNFPTVTFSQITYTQNLGEKEFTKVLNGIDDLIDEFVQEYTDYRKLETLLKNTIYTNKTVGELTIGIYSALEKDGILEMLSVMGVDATPKGVASLLTETEFLQVRNALMRASDWSKVNFNYINFGFYDGRRTGFENALVAMLRPLMPLLEVILKGETITFMDSIKVTGGEGYNTAIIPILEALGCDSKNIKTYEQYKNDTRKDAVLRNITTPVLDLLDDLFEKPVKTALDILPNALYFIDSGNLEICITNLLLPITALLEKIEPVYKVELDTNAISSSMNTNDIFKSFEKELGLKLKDFNLKALYAYGETETKISKQVLNGKNTSYTYIKADKEALLLTVLRYLVDALKLPENKGALNGMMSGGGADSFALYASQIFEQFEKMTTDEIIEWLHNLLFKERAIAPLQEGETYNPTIIYEEPPKDYTVLFIIGGVALFGAVVGLVFYLNRKKLYY
ncbi:MAG: hypothetical protein IJN49_05165 [Clostridia bacterium]|nr:hypothetical protein [Clostridia bacterium]